MLYAAAVSHEEDPAPWAQQIAADDRRRVLLALMQRKDPFVRSQAANALAEFSDSDPDYAVVETTNMQNFRKQYGAGLFWDFQSWDRAYWDVALANRVRYPVHGQGRSITILVQSIATNELPHTLKSNTLLYTPRRLAR
jgi:hypothetical protein